jgi:uncharacterized RDD family membrane protein YckC
MPDDLSELLNQLHEEMDLGEQTPTVAVGAATTLPTDASRPELAAAVVIESEGGIDFQPSFASFGARLTGLLIDTVVLAALCAPGLFFLLSASGAGVVLGGVLVTIGFCLATLLYAKGVSTTGQSFGNKVTRTRVVDARNGRTVSAGEAGTRFVVRTLISGILFIGFLLALGNSQRRTLHDNIAGTVVIRPTRATWSIGDETTP